MSICDRLTDDDVIELVALMNELRCIGTRFAASLRDRPERDPGDGHHADVMESLAMRADTQIRKLESLANA